MSIAITANWSNLGSVEERWEVATAQSTVSTLSRAVQEIPGLSRQYDIDFFRNLENKCGIRLENIVYYKVGWGRGQC